MKKLAVLLLLPLLLCGCARNRLPTGPMCRVVTQIRVSYNIDGQTDVRVYTGPRELESVLCYLRLLKKGNPADIEPDSFRSDSYEITVFYSDGQSTTYRQLHDQFLQIDGGAWQHITGGKMELLFPEG